MQQSITLATSVFKKMQQSITLGTSVFKKCYPPLLWAHRQLLPLKNATVHHFGNIGLQKNATVHHFGHIGFQKMLPSITLGTSSTASPKKCNSPSLWQHRSSKKCNSP